MTNPAHGASGHICNSSCSHYHDDEQDLRSVQLQAFLNLLDKQENSPDSITDDEYVELHFHSEHSSLDGATRVHDIPDVVKEHNQVAVAITDHGTMSGIYDIHKGCRKQGIKFIPGMEGYIVDDATKKHVPRRRRRKKKEESTDKDEIDCTDGEALLEAEKQAEKEEAKNLTSPDWESHITLLARNEQGFRNLLRLHYLGYQHKRVNTFGRVVPRIDLGMVADHREGIIVGSGCLGSQINQALIRGADDLAEKLVRDYREIFGENFYIEMMPLGIIQQTDQLEYRNNITRETENLQYRINRRLGEFAQQFSLPVMVTTDAHYARKEDKETHALLLATQCKKDLTDPTCFYFPAPYMMNSKELAKQFPVEWIRNTRRIADMCEEPDYLDFGLDYKIPEFPIPDDQQFESWKATLES